MRKTAVPLLLSLIGIPVAGFAAGPMKAGLWEMTIKSDAIRQMPKIPPAQLQQMRKLGIDVPRMTDDGVVTKVCISPAMAAQDKPPVMSESAGGCRTANYQRNGNSFTLDVQCNGALNGQGHATGTFVAGESFNSTYDFHGTAAGHPVNQHQESQGKWLGADCGDVKPADQLMPK